MVDRWLNSVTMYWLMHWGLRVVAAWAVVASWLGLLGFDFWPVVGSLTAITLTAFGVNRLLAWWFKAGATVESEIITGLILFLVLKPATSVAEYGWVMTAAAVAMASKYVVTWRRRHLFNPAAFGLVVVGLFGQGLSFWWVGGRVMLPVVVVLGLLVVRKLRRFQMVGMFVASVVVTALIMQGRDVLAVTTSVVVSGPLLFFGMIMLTEPATTPATGEWRLLYGLVAGVLYGLHFRIGPVGSSPELALLGANVLAFAVSPKGRWRMTVRERRMLSPTILELGLAPDEPLRFEAGQYLEWTLPHSGADSRGRRRYFTIASAPSEEVVRLGVRIDPKRSSSFKTALTELRAGDRLWAANLAGDFVLEPDADRPMVLVAGGVGITPFRSMVEQLVKTGQRREVWLFYMAMAPSDFVYREVFEAGKAVGVTTHYVVTADPVPAGWQGETGHLTGEVIRARVPRWQEAVYYLSGPEGLVRSYRGVLRELGVNGRRVRTDYFPGY